MAAVSNAVRRIGKTRCELCNKPGTQRSPLTRHHCDGNPKNNQPFNHMVVHRILCHTFADFITQWHTHYGVSATRNGIIAAWHTFNWRDPTTRKAA